MDCQAMGRTVRIIHHRETLYRNSLQIHQKLLIPIRLKPFRSTKIKGHQVERPSWVGEVLLEMTEPVEARSFIDLFRSYLAHGIFSNESYRQANSLQQNRSNTSS